MRNGLLARTDAATDDAPPDYAALRRRLVGVAVKFVWNRDDAEEIVQEAFRLALGSGETRGFGWMCRTVTNLCLNQRRRRKAQPLPDDCEAHVAGGPARRAEDREVLERLRCAIERLPEQQRVALVLRTMEHMEYREVAEAMDLSEAAVRTHVHLARRALVELAVPEAER